MLYPWLNNTNVAWGQWNQWYDPNTTVNVVKARWGADYKQQLCKHVQPPRPGIARTTTIPSCVPFPMTGRKLMRTDRKRPRIVL